MRGASVTATFPPYWAGTGNVAYHHARILHERGHDVTVFTAQPVEKHPIRFPFAVEYLPAAVRWGNAPLTPQLVGKLRGFDLIHLHYPYIFGSELCVWAARRFRIPLVVTYHNDLVAPGLRGRAFNLYNAISRPKIVRHADTILATSLDYAHHSLLKRALPHLKMIELANGVDLEVFRPVGKCGIEVLARFGVPPNTSAVLFVGAMDRAHFFKGVPVLIEALRSLPRVHALFVGEGNLRSRYAEQAKSLLGLRAHFVGSLQLDELVALYQQSSLTVLPSTTQGEAFGMVLLESLACGTPVVASDLPGVRTVVEHGGDGYLAPAGDPDALAEAIGYLCANPARSAAMGVSGRRKVEKFYAWSALGANLEAVYGDVLMLAATSSAHRARPTAGSACSPK